jgi:hypothetical protein
LSIGKFPGSRVPDGRDTLSSAVAQERDHADCDALRFGSSQRAGRIASGTVSIAQAA